MNGVETIETVRIELSDGTRLAARLWLPPSSKRPAPAILEYIPYRLRDATRRRDEPMHGYFAGRGYAAIRVDMRGSGDSEGLLEDEYLKLEQDDALEVIAWIAAQEWCDGGVAIIGKSWGGFNALQIAARRPAALKAIVPVCFTDDRYADDVHYMGGCLLNDNLWWGATMLAYQARPPDPRYAGEGWRDAWRQRLDAMPLWPALWLRHQRRDSYWKHGSVCEDWSAITVPALAIGGWADGYSNAVSRLLAGMTAPALGVIGPWAHIYPHDGSPGPAIGFLQEVIAFLDHWMRGRENGVMSRPKLRAYIEEWSPPATWRDPAPGRWVGEANWPSANIEGRAFHLGKVGLSAEAQPHALMAFCSKQYTGGGGGDWMGVGVPGEAPADQRIDDGQSLCFDSEALAQPLELLGAPLLELEVACDAPVGQVCARLMAVAPDGASRRLSFGMLNLTQRDSRESPEALTPGQFYRVRIGLNDCGFVVPAGHRIRLALSTAYWPMVWPAAKAATLQVDTHFSKLVLPERKRREDEPQVIFGAPERGADAPSTLLKAGFASRTFAWDLARDVATYVNVGEGGVFGEGVLRLDETMTSLAHDMTRTLSIAGDDPLSARHRVEQTYVTAWPGFHARTEASLEMTGSATHFRIHGTMQVYENGELFVSRVFDETIERDAKALMRETAGDAETIGLSPL